MANLTLIILLILAPFEAHAKITMENVSDALLKEFYAKQKKTKDNFDVEKKDVGSLHLDSLTFLIGDQLYKLVIFDDGKVELSYGQKGDIALQEILSSTTDKTSPQQIIRLVQGLQTQNVGSAQGYQASKDKVDSEDEKIRQASKTSDALRWSKLIDRAGSGKAATVSNNSDQSLSQSISAARMMNQCQSNQSAGSPQRAAAQNIAEALVFSNFGGSTLKTGDEAILSKSKDFEKKGSYSFFDEIDQFNGASPERAFQLLQKTKTYEYEIFQSSLQKSNIKSHDPYYLAANRNFMFLVRTIGKDKTLGLMESGIKKIVLNVEKFVEYRKMLPASSVIFDRIKNKYYIDPTLNQPSQARYLLSLVCLYEWKNQDKTFQQKLDELSQQKQPTAALTKEIFSMYKEFLKNTSHPRF